MIENTDASELHGSPRCALDRRSALAGIGKTRKGWLGSHPSNVGMIAGDT